MGGYQVPGHGSGDDGYDEDGYDESQRAEILEVTRQGPSDGTIQTDLDPDLEEEDDDEDQLDDLEMTDDDYGEEDDDARESEDDMDEDEVQDEFDDDSFAEDDLDITTEENQLVVRGRQSDDTEREFLHRGIAARQFQRCFVLADGMRVIGAELKNGLLSIDLDRPEAERLVRKINISVKD